MINNYNIRNSDIRKRSNWTQRDENKIIIIRKLKAGLNNGSMVRDTNSEPKIKEKEITQSTAEKQKIRIMNRQ